MAVENPMPMSMSRQHHNSDGASLYSTHNIFCQISFFSYEKGTLPHVPLIR